MRHRSARPRSSCAEGLPMAPYPLLRMGKLLSPPGVNAAHLCIDMQNLFAPGAPWATPWMERVLPMTVQFVERAPERTIFTRFIRPQNKEAARGVWRAYYEKWECVTRDR